MLVVTLEVLVFMSKTAAGGEKPVFDEMSVEDAVRYLQSNLEKGLSRSEVEARLKKYGFNEVPERKVNPYVRFARKFTGLTAWMLEAVIILSFLLHKYLDMYIVTALLFVNGFLGFIQEEKASRALEALKQKLRINARVLRDGVWQLVPARELVPGDVVRLRAGDFVPADVKIVEGSIEVDQSALTGESLPVSKEHSSIVYSGSIVRSGEATGIVVATGLNTYFGRTVELVQIARPKLHSEEVISQVVKWLLVMVGVALASALLVSYLIGLNLLDIAPLALVLLASSIPVALPAMFTISMALGSVELVKKGVLITRLNAIDDAAAMDTLCVDKTGTITMNKLEVADILPMEGFKREDVLLYGALASQEANNDPIDLAFLNAARSSNLPLGEYIQESFKPFDPKTKHTEAVVKGKEGAFRVVKGAISAVAALAGVDAKILYDKAAGFAAKGYRTLAVAVGGVNDPLKIAGLVALHDPPRKDAGKLIEELKNLGISVKMVTGDALPIAREVASRVGIGSRIVNIAELRELLEKNPEQASRLAEESDGFAEVYPEDKYTIVKSLQARGHIVGMTGDGVNDAPALKQAEVGIAVSTATDVAKGAASVVLTSEGLVNIVDLVKVSRVIHQRILTWILNKIVKTFQIVIFVVVAFLVFKKFIVSAFDVILLMFLVDFVTLSISTDNARWSRKPDVWNMRRIVLASVILGVLVVVESLVVLYVGLKYFGLEADYNALRTYSFTILFYFGVFTVFVVRERGHFWESKPSKTMFYAILADTVIVAAIATIGMPGVKPIPPAYTATVITLTLFFSLVVNDNVKYMLLRREGVE